MPRPVPSATYINPTGMMGHASESSAGVTVRANRSSSRQGTSSPALMTLRPLRTSGVSAPRRVSSTPAPTTRSAFAIERHAITNTESTSDASSEDASPSEGEAMD